MAASAGANTVTVSSPRNSAAPAVQSSSTLTPSTSTSVLSTPIPSSGSSQGGLEVGRFEILVQEYFSASPNVCYPVGSVICISVLSQRFFVIEYSVVTVHVLRLVYFGRL